MVEGTTGTDLVLKVVEMLRAKGVVGKFVEFYSEGLDSLPPPDRATIANMAPAILTVVVLVVVSRRIGQPAALTRPFTRDG